MHHVVHCLDHPNVGDRRQASQNDHRAHLQGAPGKLLVAGPLVQGEDQAVIGSFFLYEDATAEQVESFLRNDPLNKAGVWKSVEVRELVKRIDNR
ncbi:YciI family protein [Cupriavidus sp. UYPR2.512]|uniref:YciI family protein n=1 Tax=Cupriavidus sp. UYPR2.512 TaxID=1080187 RepID=UPI0003669DA7|nr:YciI family protein [Cupriavidus sp. UYPR2.512]UIF90011.1 YciI family protein [Cupriavidus necator]